MFVLSDKNLNVPNFVERMRKHWLFIQKLAGTEDQVNSDLQCEAKETFVEECITRLIHDVFSPDWEDDVIGGIPNSAVGEAGQCVFEVGNVPQLIRDYCKLKGY